MERHKHGRSEIFKHYLLLFSQDLRKNNEKFENFQQIFPKNICWEKAKQMTQTCRIGQVFL